MDTCSFKEGLQVMGQVFNVFVAVRWIVQVFEGKENPVNVLGV